MKRKELTIPPEIYDKMKSDAMECCNGNFNAAVKYWWRTSRQYEGVRTDRLEKSIHNVIRRELNIERDWYGGWIRKIKKGLGL